ncbi:hypothetical protein HYT45_01355 [Candidatus Uhrbacteria bacterium]|nr:hypothetical protein [Candidatus Uhrbacteria bacterium]
MTGKIRILVVIFVLAAVAVSSWLYFGAKKVVIEKEECKPTGCSRQVCSDEEVITTCEYKSEYACYKTAKCERQSDGKCGWSESEELRACLGSSG